MDPIEIGEYFPVVILYEVGFTAELRIHADPRLPPTISENRA